MKKNINKPLFVGVFSFITLLTGTGFFSLDNRPEDEIFDARSVAKEIPLPSSEGALAYRLTTSDNLLYMSWLEPLKATKAKLNGSASQLKWANWNGQQWSSPQVIAASSQMFSNFADRPSVIFSNNGNQYAHWLNKTSDQRFSYDVEIMQSSKPHQNWQAMGPIWKDSTSSRKGYDGFVSMIPTDKGVQAFWIDGRVYNKKNAGPMRLMTARITDKINREHILDPDICSCCDTTAVNSSEGAIIFYRGRTEDEIRDIMRVRQTADGWSQPEVVSKDNWNIAGCPVNGPQAAADKENVVISWYTAANDQPSVRAAFSVDAGKTFSKSIEIDTFSENGPVGKVDVIMINQQEAIISWIGKSAENAFILLRRIGLDGSLGPQVKMTEVKGDRQVGFPQLELINNALYLAWGIPGNEKRMSGVHGKSAGLKMLKIDINDIPPLVRDNKIFGMF